MKKSLLIIIILILLILLFWCACFRKHCPPGVVTKTDTVVHWLSWNLLFEPSKVGNTANAVQDLEAYLRNYVKSVNPADTVMFNENHCPCDPLLTNIDATLVGGSGYTVPVPPTNPNPRPSGDYVLSNNLGMAVPDYIDSNQITNNPQYSDTSHFVPNNASGALPKTLAVIDTGLDTVTFKIAYPNTIWAGNLLWQSATATGATLFNVVPGEPGNVLMDNNPVKHGTAATGIALGQIHHLNFARIPRIMSIRAFDDSERGSIYTASCAMNCAIENKADYINASWGYFGQENYVLKYYMAKANRKGIRVFAAAGNTPGRHERVDVCSGRLNTQNDLGRLKGSDSLFYPASFAPDMENLISVTQLNDSISPSPGKFVPCYYQNYSSNYITVGAYDTQHSVNPCCSFQIPFLTRNIEGSSFATPVITGIIMSIIPNSTQPLKTFIDLNAAHTQGGQYTRKGNYFNFPNIRQ
jgi:Subtilase family